tara:strand:- start:20243 stop:21529 length:1287 start_codon:yes stop_codon:yes gene_type:complete
MIEEIYRLYKKSGVVSTDTRNIQDGCLFFALKGDNFNGNTFAQDAIKAGAASAIVDEEEFHTEGQTILVESVLGTLQELATFHRSKLNIPVIAVTGSNGKTTSKELINAVLSKKYNVAYTYGNLNNHIGVPITLLSVSEAHDIALIEMGDNHPREVALLCEFAQPDFGFVTNVGKDHLEGFGSFEKNILAKKEVFDYLETKNGTVFVDKSDELVSSMIPSHVEVVTYGIKEGFSCVTYQDSNPLVAFTDELGKRVESNLFGEFNFKNIQLAYCIGKYFKVNLSDISDALSNYLPDNNRSQVVKTGRNTLVMDAYNANPSSVEEAVNSFADMDTDKPKWVVLGDMFELGSYSKEEHQNMAELAVSKNFDALILIGENYSLTNQPQSAAVKIFPKKVDAELYIKKIAPEGAIILLKGSRGMRLESLKPLF